MPFLRTFQLSMYCQVFLASGILVAAEGGVAPSLLTFVIGLVALIFNDQRGVFGLSEWWANGLALGAFCLATFEFVGGTNEEQLLAGTHLIVYLLWIVLLWKREMRHFWWISALCLLHVALSAILTQAGWFGMVLVLYVILMVWNLTLFSLYRAEQEVVSAPTVIPSESGTALNQVLPGHTRRHSQVQGNVQSDFGVSHIGRRLMFGSLATSALGVLVGSTIFVMTPRVWMQPPENLAQRRSNKFTALRSVTGFTENVHLGDIGQILESNEPVLSLRMFDHDTGAVLDIMDLANAFNMNEPYLRGAVLVNYRDGNWKLSTSDVSEEPLRRVPLRSERGLIRQEFELEPLGSNLLFAMRPIRRVGEINGSENLISLQTPSYTLTRDSGSSRVRYRIFSGPPGDPLGPDDFATFRRIARWQLGKELLATPLSSKLNALAREVVAGIDQQSLQGTDRTLAMARALESHLRDSGKYSYTLSAAVQDPTADPVDDFLFNRKSGHCEYFAAALTLMLRSVGIPARLINGFKGGEYDPQKRILRVEQRHAHSWVEAAIGDRWITLDATPAAERQRIVASHKPEFWELWKRKFWQFWNENVVSMSMARQQREVFRPLLKYLSEALSSTAGMRAAAIDFWNWFKRTVTNPQGWISIDGGILAFLLLGIPVLTFYAVRRIWRLLRKKWALGQTAKLGTGRLVEFYQRFQVLALRMGFARQPQQTQREFAAEFQQAVDASAAEPEFANLSNAITDSFYRVRFGDDTLDPDEQRLVDRQLQLVESLSKQRQM